MRRLSFTACLSLALTIAATAGTAQQPATATTPTNEAAKPADDHDWKVDENGVRYYIDKVPKAEGYRKLPDGRVRSPWGIDIQPTSEDEGFYYIRIYDHSEARSYAGPKKSWTKEEVAAIEATYPPPLDRLPTSHLIALEPFDQGLPRSGQWRNGFVFADMNGDGALDLVHGPARKQPGNPLIFLGDRKGGWHRWKEASFPPVPYDYGDVAVADFDGNGTLDLALAIHLKGVVVLAHDGKGKFSLASVGIPFQASSKDPEAMSSRTLALSDWDRDGRIDLLAAGDGPRQGNSAEGSASYGVAWYRNRGGGSWERKDDQAQDLFGESMAVADLDGDGDDDLAVGSGLIGGDHLVVRSQGESRWLVEAVPARPGLTSSVAVGDFDGDGKPELAVGHQTYEGGSWRFGLDLYRQNAAGAWERRGVWANAGMDRLLSIAAGDLDGDGRLDLAAASANGLALVLRNSGTGSFTLETASLGSGQQGCGGYHVAIQDLDGDGRGDLAISFAGEPSGELQRALNGETAERGCPDDGSLRAWRSVAAH